MSDSLVEMLRDSARDYAAREKDLRALRERRARPPGHDAAGFARMHELGWRGALVHEAHGGAGVGLDGMAAVARELGRALLGDVLLATSCLPVRLLQDAAALPAAAPLLARIAAGDTVLALAWQEQPDGLDPAAIETQARAVPGGGEADVVLRGTKRWVAGGEAADGFLVSARHEEGAEKGEREGAGAGVLVAYVPRDAPGLAIETRWLVDGSASTTLVLHDVPAATRLVAPAHGAAALARALDATTVAASAELLGIADAAFDMTLDYLKTRVQYDKPIGSFQALQHKAVDLLVQRELAASVLEEALAAFADGGAGRAGGAEGANGSEGEMERRRIASRCKARCSDAALRITRECIQLHGAIGYTEEYDLGLFVKAALVRAAWLGGAPAHRRRHAGLAD